MNCHSYSIEYGTPRCMGTKEMECCYCNGDTDNCSFYPEKRKPKKLNTAEMWIEAQKNGRQYQSHDLFYDKMHGFIDIDNNPWSMSAFDYYDEFMGIDDWTLVPVPTMTRAEAEAKLGVKIVD